MRDISFIDTIRDKINSLFNLNDGVANSIASSFINNMLGYHAQNGINKQLQTIPQVNVLRLITRSGIQDVINNRLTANVELITKVNDEFKQRVKSLVMNAVADGKSYKEIKEQLISIYAITENKAELISRTETSKLSNAIVDEQGKALGSKKRIWDAIRDERSSYHADWDGQEYEADEGINGEEPGDRPNCLLEDATIDLSYRITGAFRRFFSGELTKLVTERGAIFKSTPNHPVLTNVGWVGANDCDVGAYLVNVRSIKSIPSDKDCDNTNVKVIDIFNSLNVLNRIGVTNSVRVTNANFHGEIVTDNVDIILPNSMLEFDVEDCSITERMKNLKLTFTINKLALTFISSLAKLLFGVFSASKSFISCFSNFFTFFNRRISKSDDISLATVADGYIIPFEVANQSWARNIIFIRQGKQGFPLLVSDNNIIRYDNLNSIDAFLDRISESIDAPISQDTREVCRVTIENFRNFGKGESLVIEFDTLIDKSISKFSGHVYNLQTENGFYCANNIISHNCRCTKRIILEFED